MSNKLLSGNYVMGRSGRLQPAGVCFAVEVMFVMPMVGVFMATISSVIPMCRDAHVNSMPVLLIC